MRDLILPSTSVLIVPLPAATVDYKGKVYLLLPAFALYKSSNRLALGSEQCTSASVIKNNVVEQWRWNIAFFMTGSVCVSHRTSIEAMQHRCVESCYFLMFLLRKNMDISGQSPTVNETIKWHLVYLFLSLICYPKEIKIDIFIVYTERLLCGCRKGKQSACNTRPPVQPSDWPPPPPQILEARG